jgi:hypothetical protein
MTDYLLHLDLPGQLAPPLTVRGSTPADLAEAIHRHARGALGSRTVDILIDPDTLTGTVRRAGADVGSFSLQPKADPPPVDQPAEQDGIRWGWTLRDIDHLTQTVLRHDRWNTASDVTDRYDAIWHAIAEHLCTTTTAPTWGDLRTIGLRASDRHVNEEMRHHGWTDGNAAAGSYSAPGFNRYWMPTHAPSPEQRVVERHAMGQVLPLLTPRQRQALEALALHGTYQAAALAISSTPTTFDKLVNGGRRRFYTWWHEGETPPKRPWRKDKRVSAPLDTRGKTRLTVSQVEALRDRYLSGERLRAIAADTGIARTTLSQLLRGDRTPAPDPEPEPEAAA